MQPFKLDSVMGTVLTDAAKLLLQAHILRLISMTHRSCTERDR